MSAFDGCSSLKEIKIPESVKKIEEWAFDGCKSLKEIHIPDYKKNVLRTMYYSCLNSSETLNVDSPLLKLYKDYESKFDYDQELKKYLCGLCEIKEEPSSVIHLRLAEQKNLIQQKMDEFSQNLNKSMTAGSGTGIKEESTISYTVTDIKFSNPPYADGKPLERCPGWQGISGDYGHIDSITIVNPEGKTMTFDGDKIDEENNLVIEVGGKKTLYNIATGVLQSPLDPKKAEEKMEEMEETIIKHFNFSGGEFEL